MVDTKDQQFTHFDEAGRPQMVDVSEKPDALREAIAMAQVFMLQTTRERIEARAFDKGDVLAIAELAGVMASKRTSELIPLCHPLPLSHVGVQCSWETAGRSPDMATLCIRATVRTTYKTGVEMEALTACSVAALTVYDMCKSVDKRMTILQIHLIQKSGGKSGLFRYDEMGSET